VAGVHARAHHRLEVPDVQGFVRTLDQVLELERATQHGVGLAACLRGGRACQQGGAEAGQQGAAGEKAQELATRLIADVGRHGAPPGE